MRVTIRWVFSLSGVLLWWESDAKLRYLSCLAFPNCLAMPLKMSKSQHLPLYRLGRIWVELRDMAFPSLNFGTPLVFGRDFLRAWEKPSRFFEMEDLLWAWWFRIESRLSPPFGDTRREATSVFSGLLLGASLLVRRCKITFGFFSRAANILIKE